MQFFNVVSFSHRVLKEQTAPPPPLLQCFWGLTAQACISCVTANNIAVGEGENNVLSRDSRHFCQGEWQK